MAGYIYPAITGLLAVRLTDKRGDNMKNRITDDAFDIHYKRVLDDTWILWKSLCYKPMAQAAVKAMMRDPWIVREIGGQCTDRVVITKRCAA